MAPQIRSFKESHSAANLEPLGSGEFAGVVVIEQHCVSLEIFAQKNRAKFSNAQSILLSSCRQLGLILELLHFDPICVRNFRCSGQASSGDDHFVVNFGGNEKTGKKRVEKVEAADLCENNQR